MQWPESGSYSPRGERGLGYVEGDDLAHRRGSESAEGFSLSTERNTEFDQIVDVLVVGTGNGGLTGALVARIADQKDVLVIEKQSCLGGTSAASGGGVWVPNNRYAREAGAEDQRAADWYSLDVVEPARHCARRTRSKSGC